MEIYQDDALGSIIVFFGALLLGLIITEIVDYIRERQANKQRTFVRGRKL